MLLKSILFEIVNFAIRFRENNCNSVFQILNQIRKNITI
jgi:hypothetical protein